MESIQKSRETNPFIQYEANPSRTNAINAFCGDCMGCSATHLEPGWRKDIEYCTSHTCPLWRYRPFRKKGIDYISIIEVKHQKNLERRSKSPVHQGYNIPESECLPRETVLAQYEKNLEQDKAEKRPYFH